METNLHNLNKNELLTWKRKLLPGQMAQHLMAPSQGRIDSLVPKVYKRAAVMILLFPHLDEWHFSLMQRTTHPNDRHSGQISLPGGQFDKSDIDMVSCALRETEEEVGVPIQDIEHIQSLTPLYVPVSQFMVYPQVGIFDGSISTFNKQDEEVEQLIHTPLSTLLNESTVQVADMSHLHGSLDKVPFYNIDGHIVWGATAMILSEFKEWVKL